MSDSNVLQEWKPSSVLREAHPDEVRYSRGFLLSHPASWFPGFTAHWQPILHSFDIEARVLSIRPTMDVAVDGAHLYLGSVADELIGLSLSSESFESIAHLITPDTTESVHHLVVEYFARRFLSSLALSWSAADAGHFQFESELTLESPRFAAGVDLVFNVSGEEFKITVGFGKGLLERFHEQWRSNILQNSAQSSDPLHLTLLAGSAFLAPSEIVDTLQPGKVIELANQDNREAILLQKDEEWLNGKLCYNQSGYVFQTIGEHKSPLMRPHGTTEVRVVLGNETVDGSERDFLLQSNALVQFASETSGGQPTGDVSLFIAEQQVAGGVLVLNGGKLSVQIQSVN